MAIFKQIFFFLTLVYYINTACSVPTFGNEFVHIKLHLPHKIDASSGEEHEYQHSASSHHVTAPVIPAHKVIHHYHHRRRPLKKGSSGKHSNWLESSYKKPTFSSADFKEYPHDDSDEIFEKPIETYVVKPAETIPKKHTNTYKVIKHKKKQSTHGHYHHYHPKEPVETIRVIESKPSDYEGGYDYKPTSHIDTFKVLETSGRHKHIDDYHHKPKNYKETHTYNTPNFNYAHKTPIEETIDLTSSSKFPSYEHSQYSYDKVPESYEHYNKNNYDSVRYPPISLPDEIHVEHEYQSSYRPSTIDSGYNYAPQGSSTSNYRNNYEHDYAQNFDTGYRSSSSSTIAAADSYLPSSSDQQTENHHYEQNVRQNTLFDDEVFTVPKEPETWTAHYNKPNTYSGLDSYSAGHVQGVDSTTGYPYPTPFL